MNFLILLDHVMVSGSRFLLSVLIARALGLDDFGIYALLWTIVTLASSMQISATITPMMQLRPRLSEHRQTTFFATGLLVQLAYSFIAIPFITFATLIIVWGRDDAWSIVLAVNAYIIVYNQYEYFRRYFFSKGQYFIALAFDAVLYGVVLAIILGFLHLGGISIAVYLGLACLPAALASILILWRYEFTIADRAEHGSQARRMWRIAKPLIISTLAAFISGHVFVYASGAFLGAENVGGIAAVRNLMGPLIVFMMALENSMTRDAVIAYKQDKEQFFDYVRKVRYKWIFVFAVYAIAVSLIAKPLLVLVYGDEFGQFYALVYWMALASISQIITRIQAIKLRTMENYAAIKRANLGAMFVSLIVAPPLIYFFGLTGAGISILVVTNSMMILQFLGENDHEFWLPWAKPVSDTGKKNAT